MKNLFTLLVLCFTIGVFAQNNVSVKINHKLGTDDFNMNTVVTSYEGYNVEVSRLQYYLNNFKITHDGGQETITTDHFLVNAGFPKGLFLGTHDIVQVEKITFSVGVHPDDNHLDPATFSSIHPLAPQNPSMHWGWASGYRFIALEGNAGSNLSFSYEVHALGDVNYKTVSIPVEGTLDGTDMTISLDADYLGMFKNMDVSDGLINHGETGAAITLLNNFETEVFSASVDAPVTTIDPTFEGKFQIQPNPSFDKNTNVILNLPAAADYQLTLTDLMGRVIQTQEISFGEQNIEMTSNHSGVFFIHLWKEGEPVAFEKWIVK